MVDHTTRKRPFESRTAHADPEKNGVRFGEVIVTVDMDQSDCVVTAPRPGLVGTVPRRMHLHSLDEIRGAYQMQMELAATNPVARDIAAALKYAGQKLKRHDDEGA